MNNFILFDEHTRRVKLLSFDEAVELYTDYLNGITNDLVGTASDRLRNRDEDSAKTQLSENWGCYSVVLEENKLLIVTNSEEYTELRSR